MERQLFQYCIDSPSSHEIINSPFVLIRGWIISERGNVIANPSLCCANQQVESLTIINRPDVELAYPNHSVIGFSHLVSIPDIPLENDWSIEFLINQEKHRFNVNFSFNQPVYENFLTDKKSKLKKIREILLCPICGVQKFANSSDIILTCCNCESQYSFNSKNYNLLSQNLIEQGGVKPTENISANSYDTIAINIIEQFKDGLILDNGCGLRNIYYDNVVNFEIVDYPTTDVIGIGEKLPFKSEVFDAVFSLAVLEHVKHPFQCAQEIARVLKPGGTLYAAVPFLQPFHGYPDHYYNMTSSGLKNLFSEQLQIIECSVPLAGLPIWCLTWFLNSYIRGLPEPVAKNFKDMKVGDLLDTPMEYLNKDFVTQLRPEVNEELACVNCLIAKKL